MRSESIIGKQIQEYIIQERMVRGTSSNTYRAYQPSKNRDVSLQLIRIGGDEAAREAYKASFEQEMQRIVALEHVHILSVYDYGMDKGLIYIVTRLLRGGTLADLSLPVSLERASTIISQVGRGLHYAHQQNVLHRNLRPESVILDGSGNAWLSDFNPQLSDLHLDTHTSGERSIATSMIYRAPERLLGEDASELSDIYALGTLFYQLLTDKTPFEMAGGTLADLVRRKTSQSPKPPRDYNPDIPPTVQDVMLRALATDPNDRYATANEFVSDLERTLRGLFNTMDVRPLDSITLPKRPEELMKRLPQEAQPPTSTRNVAVISAVVLLLVGAVVFLTWRPSPAPIVLIGETTAAAAVIPSDREVRAARSALGEEGFVAYIACNQSSEFHATRAREIREFLQDYGLEGRIYDSDSDPSLEIARIEEARGDGASALVTCPLNMETVQSPLQDSITNGIPVVMTTGAPIENLSAIWIIGNNYQLGNVPGRFAGTLVTEELDGEADVVLLDFPSLPDVVQRANGMEDGLLENAPDANVIGRFPGGTQAAGRESVAQLIENGTEFDVILSINDAGAYGAIEALEDADIGPDEVIIVSVDAEQLAQQYIRNGHYIRGSIEPGRTEGSQAAVNAVVKLLGGGAVPQIVQPEPGDILTQATLPIEG